MMTNDTGPAVLPPGTRYRAYIAKWECLSDVEWEIVGVEYIRRGVVTYLVCSTRDRSVRTWATEDGMRKVRLPEETS